MAIKNGRVPKEVGENAALMLLDTAAGVQFLEWVQSSQNGAAPSGIGYGGVGNDRKRSNKK
ncbi:MAG: hypothetical protein U5K75_00060 [Ahrensia sp.]|nr:hypothetical protein [Ahrensia sp.]